jgi:CheY-like chemotaxis protein
MPPSIQFQDEAAAFLTETEQTLLALEQTPTDTALQESTINLLRTLRGIADLFNIDNTHLILSMAVASFAKRLGQEIPAELINIAITLIDQIRTLHNHDFGTQESHNIMAKFSIFADQEYFDRISKKQAKDIHILVVDDELVNRTLLVEFIKTFHSDIKITAVDSATEAIFYYLTEDFDLVFLDIMMPEVDGNHFIAIVEKNRKLGRITSGANIVVQTAVQSLAELLAIVQHECVLEVIRKPILRERISTCIERYCTPFQTSQIRKQAAPHQPAAPRFPVQ